MGQWTLDNKVAGDERLQSSSSSSRLPFFHMAEVGQPVSEYRQDTFLGRFPTGVDRQAQPPLKAS